MKLSSNSKAPNFKLPSTNGNIIELGKIKKNIILYFYPKDDTPGCTLESKDFSKLNHLINKSKTIILGVSKDSIESHLKFKKKYKLKFDLLSDEKKEVIKKYGVWGKKSFLKMIEKENLKLSGKVVTKVSLVKNYCPAEEYHQRYLEKR